MKQIRESNETSSGQAVPARIYNPVACVLAMAASLAVSGCTGSSNAEYRGAAAAPAAGDYGLDIVTDLPPPPQTNQGADQPIAENDLLEVDVFQVDELDREVRVDSRGRISLALIGAVDAKGRTLTDLEAEIEQRYAVEYLENPEVSVFMEESAGQRVTIDGSVRKPGIFPVTTSTTLLQVIALAGGFEEVADEEKVYVFRDMGERKLVANYNVRDIRSGKQRDPRIYGGDVIVSFQSGAKVAARNLREALGIASNAVRIAAPL